MKFFKILPLLLLGVSLASPSLAEGDAKKGKKVFKKCKACHSVKPDDHKTGPSLFNIVDAKVGSAAEYKYSTAMQSSELVWDEATLTDYLKDPKGYLPGTKMQFSGLKKEKDLINILAYLKTLSKQ